MANHEFKWKHFAPEIILWCLRWYGSTPKEWGKNCLFRAHVKINSIAISVITYKYIFLL